MIGDDLKPIGVIYMCRPCAVYYNFFSEEVRAGKGQCVRCGDSNPLEIPVSFPKDYDPEEGKTTNNPPGIPWYTVVPWRREKAKEDP
jgi:hypothetical protein